MKKELEIIEYVHPSEKKKADKNSPDLVLDADAPPAEERQDAPEFFGVGSRHAQWWRDNQELIVAHTQPAIAVYDNLKGDIVIRQEDLLGKEAFVCLTPIHAEVVAKAILQVAAALAEAE